MKYNMFSSRLIAIKDRDVNFSLPNDWIVIRKESKGLEESTSLGSIPRGYYLMLFIAVSILS